MPPIQALLESFVKHHFVADSTANPENKAMLEGHHIGERLDSAIKRAKTTKSALARAVDVSPQAVTDWIKTGNIARERIPAIVRHVRCGYGELLSGDLEDAPIGGPIDARLLESAIADARSRFRAAGQIPDDEQLAEAATIYYEQYLETKQRQQSRPLPRRKRGGEGAA